MPTGTPFAEYSPVARSLVIPGACFSEPAPQTFMTSVVNVVTTGVVEWSEDAVDVVSYDNGAQVLASDGVWQIMSEPQAPSGYIRTGNMDFLPGEVCTVSRAYPKVKVEGDILLQTITAEDGTDTVVSYTIPDIGDTVARKRNIRLARGVEGSEWSFKIGVTPEVFELRGLEVKPEWARRRRV